MITTSEALVDPVAFVKENHESFDGEQIVSGLDFDVLVSPINQHTSLPTKRRRLEKIVSPVLGELYMQGEAYAVPVGEQRANLTWFPSPHYVNEMLGSLGLEPGQDVLRFTHASHDEITGHEYASHLADGEYPQSVGSFLFGHDRRDDHAIAVILSPEVFTRGVMAVAQEHTGHDELPNIRRKGKLEEDIVTKFDDMTFGLRNLIRTIWPQILKGGSTAELDLSNDDFNWYGSSFDSQTKARYMQILWGMDKQTSRSRKQTWQHVADLVFERLNELAPAISELQKAPVASRDFSRQELGT